MHYMMTCLLSMGSAAPTHPEVRLRSSEVRTCRFAQQPSQMHSGTSPAQNLEAHPKPRRAFAVDDALALARCIGEHLPTP